MQKIQKILEKRFLNLGFYKRETVYGIPEVKTQIKEKIQSAISDKVPEINTETKQMVEQTSFTLFISKDDTKRNRLPITNAYKRENVKIEIVASSGKDYYVKPAKTQNSDEFNRVTKDILEKLGKYGVRKSEPYTRKYNHGGKTL